MKKIIGLEFTIFLIEKRKELIMKALKNKWHQIYSYAIPSVIVFAYVVYIILIYKGNISGKCIQNSNEFSEMLKTVVTFMSIVLSVFGFLIPSFLNSKGSSLLIQFFLENADLEYFTKQLKNIVAVGLIEIFVTCCLLLSDIIPECILNIAIIVWLWMLLYFLCSAFRYIGIMIKMMMGDKKDSKKNLKNEINPKKLETLNNKLPKV